MLQKKYNKRLFGDEPVFVIASLLFASPNKVFHLRRLAREANLSTTATYSALSKLEKSGIAQVNKNEVTSEIRSRLDSKSYYFYKRILNLLMIENHQIIPKIEKELRPESIVLFGSFSRGEDIEESDIDILVISKNKSNNAENILEKFGQAINRNIHLTRLTSLEGSSQEFKNAIANGIVLFGYVKVV